ncbi:MAG TPA: hypothetical protein VKB72_06595 [Steroidobacteraceae bacterium]|nr:hypothetical protein [Steroidobacteraceae bacterium]
MRVASPGRGRPARLLRAMVPALAALLGACHSSSTTPPGTPVVTMGGEGTSADFASYVVIVDSISLTRTDGTLITLLGGGGTSPQEIDFAQLGTLAEMVEAPAAPSGTYTSATMSLDFTNAQVWVNQNGQPVRGSVTVLGGGPVYTVTITFDPSHPLVITQGVSQRLQISLDLAASNTITAGSPPGITVQPFVVLSPAPVDSTVMRARGLFVTVPSGSSTYVQNSRPFFDQQSALGALTINTNTQTYFSVDGVSYTGAAGLAAMQNLQISTPTAAIGTLDNLSGITPTMNATQVYAGVSLESPIAVTVTGVVGARSGNTLTILGPTCFQPTSSFALGSFSYLSSLPVTVGSNTVVSEDGVGTAGLNAASISVGQQITAFGLGNVEQTTLTCLSLDSTSGFVRLNSTRVWGTLNSATAGNASLDVLSLGNFAPAGFDFAGTGAGGQDANPAAYSVNTGALDQSAVAAGTLLQVDGTVAPFGAAPPDFTAHAITPGTETPQQLVVEWENGGSTAPFTHAGSDYLQVNLADPNIVSVHYIRTGPATLDLKSLTASPQITTTGAAQNNLQLAVGSATLSTGISVYNSASAFATALASTFPASGGTKKIYRLVAYGQYNAATNTFVAGRISVALHQ